MNNPIDELIAWLDEEIKKHKLDNTMNESELWFHSGSDSAYRKVLTKLRELGLK